MQGRTATMRHGVTKKEAQKKLKDTENLFRNNLQLKDVGLKATKIICQRKAFYRQRIPEFSCARKLLT